MLTGGPERALWAPNALPVYPFVEHSWREALGAGGLDSPPISDSRQVKTGNGSTRARRSRAWSCRLRLLAQGGDPVLQRPQADPQHLGGEFAIAAHVIEGELDVSLLDFQEWLARLQRDRTIVACRQFSDAVGFHTEGREGKVFQPNRTRAGELNRVAVALHDSASPHRDG
jgi:hypothetical protein